MSAIYVTQDGVAPQDGSLSNPYSFVTFMGDVQNILSSATSSEHLEVRFMSDITVTDTLAAENVQVDLDSDTLRIFWRGVADDGSSHQRRIIDMANNGVSGTTQSALFVLLGDTSEGEVQDHIVMGLEVRNTSSGTETWYVSGASCNFLFYDCGVDNITTAAANGRGFFCTTDEGTPETIFYRCNAFRSTSRGFSSANDARFSAVECVSGGDPDNLQGFGFEGASALWRCISYNGDNSGAVLGNLPASGSADFGDIVAAYTAHNTSVGVTIESDAHVLDSVSGASTGIAGYFLKEEYGALVRWATALGDTMDQSSTEYFFENIGFKGDETPNPYTDSANGDFYPLNAADSLREVTGVHLGALVPTSPIFDDANNPMQSLSYHDVGAVQKLNAVDP